MVHKN
jgi:chromosome segregation ATPase